MGQLIYEEESYIIRGAVFEVYKEMGCGFLEQVYQECLEKEFTHRGVPFVARGELRLMYKGEFLEQTYEPDFVCCEKIILELKAVKALAPEHKAQLMSYLKATGLKLGFLINFGASPKVEIERFVL